MSGDIDAVRARLARDLSLRLVHRDTAGDVQALLDHHAKLQAASSDVVLAVDVAMGALEPWLDNGADEDAPQMACHALAEAFRKAGLFTAGTTQKLTITVDTSAVQAELASVQAHISALPVLIEAVRRLPDAEQVLAQWDKARAVRHG